MASEEDDCEICGTRLRLDRDNGLSWQLWLDTEGGYATCGDGVPHVPARWLR